MGPSELLFFPAAEVAEAHRRGDVLFGGDGTLPYAVHASRRDAPGEAEQHARHADLMFILQGRATIVIGGTIQMPRQTGPDETRGAGIENGREQAIGPGDAFIIRPGVPHWFREVRGPLLYFTVKLPRA